MTKSLMLEDETLEELQPGGFLLLQKKKGFRFGMDSVLLAEFAGIHPQDDVADFGSGSCVLPLLLISRNKGKSFTCIEIQKEIAEMAKRTIRMNHLENQINVIYGMAENVSDWLSPCSMDAVVCNPPYNTPGTVISSPNPVRAISRVQKEETLSGFFRAAYSILKGKGSLNIVYPAPQMLHVMKLLQQAHLEPKRFQLIYPYEHKPANLVLIEAVKDARPTLHPMPPLIIYNEDHLLTNRLKSIYHIE